MAYSTFLQWGCRVTVKAGTAAILVFGAVASPEIAAQPTGGGRYSAAEYARLDDPGDSPVIRRINGREEVAAGLRRSNSRGAQPRAQILTRGGAVDIGPPQAVDFSAAYALNDDGEVAGAFNGSVALRPFRSMRRSAFVALPVLPGHTGGVAFGINARGDAVGYSSGDNQMRAVWWTRTGELQLLPGGSESASRALGVNNRGDVVGVSGEAPQRAVIWPAKGQAVDLGTLPGFSGSEALATNNRGDVVGNALGVDGAPDRSRAVWWDAGGRGLQDLGTLPGDTDSRANDINARGDVVGSSSGSRGDRAFLWTARDGMVDLNRLVPVPGVVLIEALGINDNGSIVAIGQEGGHDHGPGEEHGDHELPRRVLVLRPQGR